MSYISLTYGKVTFPKSSAVIAAFAVTAPFTRVLASKAHPKAGASTRHAAGNQALDGMLISESINMPEGTILLLQMQRKQGGLPIADGAIFLRIRTEAALVSIAALLPVYHGSSLGTMHSVFEGRADILTRDDLVLSGIAPSENYLRGFCNQEEVDECYVINTVSAAVSAAPRFTVETSSTGEVVAIQADTRVRRMRVRKA